MVGRIFLESGGWVQRGGIVQDGYNRVVFDNGYASTIKQKDVAKYKLVSSAPKGGRQT